jgi:hypothetical protein
MHLFGNLGGDLASAAVDGITILAHNIDVFILDGGLAIGTLNIVSGSFSLGVESVDQDAGPSDGGQFLEEIFFLYKFFNIHEKCIYSFY